jgi:hypothetical protein
MFCICGINTESTSCTHHKDSAKEVYLQIWLIDYLRFYVPLKNFSLYGDVTIAGETKKKMCVSGYPTYPIFLPPTLNFFCYHFEKKFRKLACFPEPVL